MKQLLSVTLLALTFAGCNASKEQEAKTTLNATIENTAYADAGTGNWKGTFSNGMKGDKISFDIKGGTLQNLTFQGHWRCNGRLESTILGPGKEFSIKSKTVEGTFTESGFYYELQGTLDGNKASGTLRIAFTGLGCDTYKLKWTAERR